MRIHTFKPQANEFIIPATQLAYSYNMMIWPLNTIYLQGPHILPEQQEPLLHFAETWHNGVGHHYRVEDGLETFTDYVRRCLAGEAKYEGDELVRSDPGQFRLGVLAGAVFLMVTHDVGYEDGIHDNVPPTSAPITWGLRNGRRIEIGGLARRATGRGGCGY
ncbi:hemerythrin HHE cation binding domain-containing protein [Biscogniauxia marginata]|nr:hemerythrin HHE cation binding domain-containing protein [Biscogniauxia marginata]